MIASPLRSFHASNLLTYLSLLLAVMAMGAAIQGVWHFAGALIAFAVIADTFDGAFARLFPRDNRQRAFGAQIDSLSDAIAFGIAPAICSGLLSWQWQGPLAFAAGFAFAACAITRLAHFNLHHQETRGFIGIPVPVAALIWSTALLFGPSRTIQAVVLAACAAAMVAPLRIPRPTGAGLIAFALWPAAVAIAHML